MADRLCCMREATEIWRDGSHDFLAPRFVVPLILIQKLWSGRWIWNIFVRAKSAKPISSDCIALEVLPMSRTSHRLLFSIFLTVCLLSLLSPRCGAKEWLPISKQEKEITQVPGNPGAAAIQLYYSQDIDDNEEDNEAEYIYSRIKILNEKGNKYADVKIVVPTGFHLLELKARTIHPDGKVIEYIGQPFDNIIARGKGFRWIRKSFTLPKVTPGSIIEYKYKLDYPPNEIPHHEWKIQHDLYTLKEYFRIRAYTGRIKGIEGGTGLSLSYNLPKGVKPKNKGEGFELKVENIPAFEEEAYMPPKDLFAYHVSFFYGGREVSSVDKFWHDTGLKWSAEAESFIGKKKEISEAAAQAIAGETDPKQKLRKLYARAQQVRNLTYERERNKAEQKKESLKDNRSAADVLDHGYGDREDITYFFIALARAAGFEAVPVKTSNRATTILQKTVLDAEQLDSEVALVKLNGEDLFLDPGTPFCPFGMLRWIRTSTEGLALDKDNPVFVKLPGFGYEKAVIQRTANVTLGPDGSLKGEVAVIYSGTQALERRLDALQTDDAGRAKNLEDEMQEWLPRDAVVKLKDASGWEDSEKPLHADFTVEVPSYGSVAGKRIVVPAYLFSTVEKDAFNHDKRKYPIYFQYASGEMDNVKIKTPPGFVLEGAPPVQSASLPYANYQNVVRFSGGELVTTRVLQLNIVSAPVTKFGELKTFFSKVQAGDEEQAVLKEGTASVQQGN